MGWTYDGAEDHEGWVACVLADGRDTSASTGGGVLLMRELPEQIELDREAGWEIRPADRGNANSRLYVVAPWSAVVAWQSACACGWRGRSVKTTPESEGESYFGQPCPEIVENALMDDWSAHVRPMIATQEIAELWREARELHLRLAAAVQKQRQAGISWAKIGQAAGGMTAQGAQQRWGTSSIDVERVLRAGGVVPHDIRPQLPDRRGDDAA
jgi:hypothetical protein